MYLGELLETAGLTAPGDTLIIENGKSVTSSGWHSSSTVIRPEACLQRALAWGADPALGAIALFDGERGIRAFSFKRGARDGSGDETRLLVNLHPVAKALAGEVKDMPPVRVDDRARLESVKARVEKERLDWLAESASEAGEAKRAEPDLEHELLAHDEFENDPCWPGFNTRCTLLELRRSGERGEKPIVWSDFHAHIWHDWPWTLRVAGSGFRTRPGGSPEGALFEWLGVNDGWHSVDYSGDRVLLQSSLGGRMRSDGVIRDAIVRAVIRAAKGGQKRAAAYRICGGGVLVRTLFGKTGAWTCWLPRWCTKQLSDSVVGSDSKNFRWQQETANSPTYELEPGEGEKLDQWCALIKLAS